MGKKASRPWYFLRTSLNIRLSQNIHRCSHLDLQKLFPPLSLATGLAAGQRHISLEQLEKQREEQRTVRVLRHLSSMPCPPPRTQLQYHQNQDEVTAAATNQHFCLYRWISCGKTVGSLCSNERNIWVFSTCPTPKHRWRPQNQTSNMGEKQEESTASDREEGHLPGSLTSVLLPFDWEEAF